MVEQFDNYSNKYRIEPDFIYNRADLFCNNYIILHISNVKCDYYLEVQLLDKYAILDVWMMTVTGNELDEISNYIFKQYKQIEYLSFYYMISDRFYIKGRHFHVVLPESYDELERRISSKGRYNQRRMKKLALEEFGSIVLKEYENKNIPSDIIISFFEMKKKTHGVSYKMSSEEYLVRYHVSNAYVLYFGNMIAAIMLTCEQCSVVYLENLAYDKFFSKYSPGMMAYDLLLEILIKKGKTAVFLGGGDYDYKKKYDSVETAVTEGKIYKSWLIELKYKWIDIYNKYFYWRILGWKLKLFV